MKRVKTINSDPNPLFMQWLKEFREEAKQKDNSGLVKVYNMCIENLSRFPLPLDTGTQCKVLAGFGKTICARLDQKLGQQQRLVQHQIKPPSPSRTGLKFPLSPVLVPAGQLPQSSENLQLLQPLPSNSAVQLSPETTKVQPRLSISPCPSESYSPPKSAIFDLSPEIDLRSQEEKDLELALALSQREVSGGDDSFDNDPPQLSQLEQDHQFALKLQAEFSGAGGSRRILGDGSGSIRHSPTKFSFDTSQDYQLAQSLSQTALSDDEDDLPDISLTRRVRSPVKVSEDNNTNNLAQADLVTVNANTDHRPAKKAVRVTNHNISVSSGEEEEAADPLDKLFANDPVFNSDKKTAKGKYKAKPNNSKSLVESDASVTNKTPVRKNRDINLRTPTSTPKVYVPKSRTGAYAVLVTLYQHSSEVGYPGYMTKTDLCQAAQPLSEHSFTLANVRTEHYNAWSGVGTLLKHGLVTKWSNPAKFNITDKGMELASRIMSIESGEEGEISIGRTSAKRTLNPHDVENDGPRRKKKSVGSETIDKDKSWKTKANKQKKVGSSIKSKEFSVDDNDPLEADDIDADLLLAIELSRKDAAASASSQALAKGGEAIRGLGLSGVDFDLGGSFSMEQTLTEEDFAVGGSSSSASVPQTSVQSTTTTSTLPLPLALAAMYRSHMGTAVQEENMHQPQFVLRRGNFDILLCVDNTEIKGGGVGGRQNLKVETVRHLQQCGTLYDRRNLNIGDFLWIAREKVAEVDGQFRQKQPKELVLPFVVERKRLDDLWMSVKDGRYEEQKFRMKGCGLPHLYYLIEDHPGQKQFWGRAAGQGGALVTPEAIEQAVANTAVQEGFTVKKTADQKGTIEYLTIFTRLLKEKYKNLDLNSCTNSDLADGLIGRRDTTLLNFQEFNDSSKKSKPLTVTEVFAKMLLRLKGLSVDMAQTIVRVYPTPRHLMEGYSKCDNGVERVKLISDLVYGMEGKRKIPKAVAEALMKFWTSASLL